MLKRLLNPLLHTPSERSLLRSLTWTFLIHVRPPSVDDV